MSKITIDDSKKGVPARFIEKPEDYENQPELTEKELLQSEERAYRLDQDLDEKEKRLQEWEQKGEENLRQLRQRQDDAMCSNKKNNYIGERIAFIRKMRNVIILLSIRQRWNGPAEIRSDSVV
jgi:hypothetical protein